MVEREQSFSVDLIKGLDQNSLYVIQIDTNIGGDNGRRFCDNNNNKRDDNISVKLKSELKSALAKMKRKKARGADKIQ